MAEAMVSPQTPAIPLVDLSAFTTVGEDAVLSRQKVQEIREKCSRYGCLAIEGHGLSSDLLKEGLQLAKRLFDLPMADKLKAPHPDSIVPHRGYSAPGREKTYSKSDLEGSDPEHGEMLRKTQHLKESYEIGDETNRDQCNIWLPEEVLNGFRSQSYELFERLRRLSFAVLDALIAGADVTKQERTALLEVHSGPVGQLRLLHYPSVDFDESLLDEAKRLPEHTDWSSFTLSFQDAAGGLEFRDPYTGSYMPVTPRENIVHLNIGDMMERLSNGLYPSCTHRVVLPKSRANPSKHMSADMKSASARYSVVFFFSVNADAMIAPTPTLVKRDSSAKFNPTTYRAYAEERSKWHYEDYQKGTEEGFAHGR